MVPLPSHAAWFRLGAVHGLERRALPEWFDGASAIKTAESYVEMRDLIITTYREAPGLQLSVTECRRHIAIHDRTRACGDSKSSDVRRSCREHASRMWRSRW